MVSNQNQCYVSIMVNLQVCKLKVTVIKLLLLFTIFQAIKKIVNFITFFILYSDAQMLFFILF